MLVAVSHYIDSNNQKFTNLLVNYKDTSDIKLSETSQNREHHF